MGAVKNLLIEAEEEELEILTYLNDLLAEHGWVPVPPRHNKTWRRDLTALLCRRWRKNEALK